MTGRASNKARRQGAVIVFWDESGFLMLPTVQRTWAPRGHRPLLWRQLKHQCRISANGLICISPFQHRLNCYHFLWPHDAIDETVIVAVLRQMRRHFRQPIILLWDRLQVHRSSFVNDDMAHAPSLDIEHFPADVLELNPVEAPWSDTKQHDLAQFCPHTSASWNTPLKPPSSGKPTTSTASPATATKLNGRFNGTRDKFASLSRF